MDYKPGDWQYEPALAKRMHDAAMGATIGNLELERALADYMPNGGRLSFKVCLGCKAVVQSHKAQDHIDACEKAVAWRNKLDLKPQRWKGNPLEPPPPKAVSP